MCYDYSKLLGKIVEIFGSQIKFATAMKWSERTLSLKLNNKVSWKQPEIDTACTLLEIPNDEIVVYFFTKKVQ
ncbi:DUF739 family protein [Clostridiales Family XIII bacterium ASD5510]|uniref:DUF739 family protein n=1 Tax=Hominibacterium faecale TaxID=2839743 RepID=A0A9J6QZ99_9FIRM|nr:DUF739 family protein [Hominibacterium faecale]MCU7380770.1 DUF739 family protein [Hominibacterium faecale]